MTNLLQTIFGQKTVKPFETAGASGTVIHGGYIQEDEKSAELTGATKYKTFSDIIANVSIVSAGTRYFLNLIAKSGWKVQAPEGVEGAEDKAKLVRKIMDDMETPWHRVIRRAAMYKFYGFSVQEWTAKVRPDGVIGFEDIAPRPQITIERWLVDKTGKVEGMLQRSPQTQEEIFLPREKVVYVVDDSLNDSPEGLGLFRHIVDASKRLRRYEALEGWGFETDLRGIPIGRAPLALLNDLVDKGELTAAQLTEIKQPLVDFITNHVKGPKLGLLIDSKPYQTADEKQAPSGIPQWDMGLLQNSSTALEATARAIERINREIARVLGVETLLLGEGGKGSLALSRDKTNSFFLIVDSTLTELAESFEHDFLRPLWNLNGWDPAQMPKLKTESIQFRDIEQITGALRDIAAAGLSPDDPATNEIRDLLGLSRLLVDDMMLDSSLILDDKPEVDDEEEEEETE